MTGNLIPEPRVNVNGHVVVKHVRGGSDSPERKSKMPAPRHSELPKAPLLNKSLMRVTDGSVMLSSLNPEAATRVESLLQWVKTERPTARGKVEDEIRRAVFRTDKKESRNAFNNLGVFGDVVVVRDMYYGVENYVKGLQMCPEFAGMKDFLTNGTPAKREHAQALVRFASAFSGNKSVAREFIDFGLDHSFVRVKDAELRRLVMDYPNRADDIADVIKSEGIADAKHLREIIKHGQQSLRDGVL
jgi:hypothetical protein